MEKLFVSFCLSILLITTEGNIIPFNSTSIPLNLNSSFQITNRLNPSNSFLTTFDYDVSSCSCTGTDNLRYNGIWVSWDNRKGSRPDNSVYAGSDNASGSMYVMRVQFNNNGLIVGKYSPQVKAAWIPYGGVEYGGFSSFEVKRKSLFSRRDYINISMKIPNRFFVTVTTFGNPIKIIKICGYLVVGLHRVV